MDYQINFIITLILICVLGVYENHTLFITLYHDVTESCTVASYFFFFLNYVFKAVLKMQLNILSSLANFNKLYAGF